MRPRSAVPTRPCRSKKNLAAHTGSVSSVEPAPELLSDVAARAPIRLEDFLTLAEKSNPTLAQARATVARSEQQGRQAALPPNPSVAYYADQIRGGSYGGGEQGAYIQQELVLGGKLGLRRGHLPPAGRQRPDRRRRAALPACARDVAQAFTTALTEQAMVQARQSLLKVALDAVATSHRLENLGEADAPDVLQAEVEAEQARIDFVQAQRMYLQAFAMLSAVAGAPRHEVHPLQGDLEQPPQLDTAQQVAAILADSPSLHRAQQAVAIAEARHKDARRESIPNLTLRAGEYYSGEQVEGSRKAAGPESFAEASIDLPLWNRNQGNVGAANADLERARQEVTRTRLELEQLAEPLAQQYLAARFTAERYRTELLPRSRRAYELYLMKYEQMGAAYPQVLASQRTFFQLRISYLQALHEEWRTALALQNYTLSNGLEQPMSAGQDNTQINLPTGGTSQ